jgi:transposase
MATLADIKHPAKSPDREVLRPVDEFEPHRLPSLAEQIAKIEAAQPVARPAPPKRNRGSLPAHLPRVEVVIDVASKTCPCCGAPLHAIGEDRAEMLDHVPAQPRVQVIRRPRYGCLVCEQAVVQAPALERPIDGGMATEALLAHVLVSKYADHVPLYRQAQIFGRQGVTLDRSTLSNWVGRACWWLEPLHALILSSVLSSPKVVADDTTLPVLDPGRGTHQDRAAVVLCHRQSPVGRTRSSRRGLCLQRGPQGRASAIHLKGFQGLLQVDGYAGFGRVLSEAANQPPRLAFCWAHARRKFYDVHIATKSPLAHEALQRIAALYAIESEIRGRPAEDRKRERQQRSHSLVEALQVWWREQLGRLSGRSKLAQAIRYAFNHWDGLIRFLDDGRLEMDTNIVERAMRPIALGRKNALFAGADSGGRHWSIVATLIQSAELNDVEPLAWLADVLKRIVSGQTKKHELHTLLPWNWKPPNETQTVSPP